MIIFLYGEDTYNSQQKLQEIKQKFIAKTDPSGININTFDGQNFDLEKFNNAASQSGFLVKKRLVIVKNLLKNKFTKEQSGDLKELLAKLGDSENIFVFWEADSPDKKNELFKLLSKNKKYVQESTPLENTRLTSWLKKYLQNHQGEIEPTAINQLLASSGHSLWLLANETDKLLAYGRGKITLAAVLELTQTKIEENIFALIDAISQGQKKNALKLLDEQLKSGLSEIFILSMIIRQFRIILQLKSLLEERFSESAMIKQTGLHPFVVKKTLPLAKKFAQEKLQQIYAKLLELEKKFKSTSLPSQALLELFILGI